MDEKPFESMNVIPFVDIMLVLLTIVLTTASFIATGHIPIALPKAQATAVHAQKPKMIELSKAGGIALDGKAVSKEALEADLKALPPETAFLIRADRDLPFQIFVDVADVLRRLDFKKVAIQTEVAK
ncbi:ExbD/TolR family protein [Rhodomicrobium sp.]|uniref:ExbD/TolR family protein n=1 Tax=Rhodomicrobium sp. TaxID=2720632 RepID=UPI0039E6B31A